MLYKKRARYAPLEQRAAAVFGRVSKNPNVWTALALLLAMAAAYMVLRSSFAVAAVLLAVSAILDVIDGAVARLYKTASPKGAYIDTVADRFAEAVVIASFLFVPLPFLLFPAAAWIALLLFGSMMTTYAKAAAAEKGFGSPLGVLLERAERMFLLFLIVVVGHFDKTYMFYGIIFMAFLVSISALQRIMMVLRE